MSIILEQFDTVKKGLAELINSAYSISQNMKARVKTPILEDKTNLWNIWLDSNTIQLYCGANEDKRCRFKIDHEFNLDLIINSNISSDGSIAINAQTYMDSKGAEFIIIKQSELKGAEANYAIKSDKYDLVKQQLNKGKLKAKQLEKSGGFKINEYLNPKEALNSDGWKELAVGKNKATKRDYKKADNLLENYVSEAKKQNCFGDGEQDCFSDGGMGFFVEIGSDEYNARPWFVLSSGIRSDASYGSDFSNSGRFLRVSSSQKISTGNKAYEITEQGIAEYLKKNPVKNERFAKVLLTSANNFYQKQ